MKNIKKFESDVRGYSRSFPVIFESAVGATIKDTTGRKYIDFFAGAGALNYGHNNPYMKKRLLDYLEKDGVTHGLDMATTAKEEFIGAFDEYILKPRKLEYKIQFTGPTGTNTVEAALKLAQIVKGRNQIISFTNAYHGHTKGSLRLTANEHYRKGFEDDLNQNTTFFPFSEYLDDFDTTKYLEKVIKDPGSGIDLPAAVIVETIQGEGGVNVASAQWLRELRRITAENDILLIIDDIQAGCGRSGDFFSFEESGIKPDMVTLSKSLSGYGLPMSIMLMKPDLDQWLPGHHTGTFRGNNLAFITATEAITRYWKEEGFTKEIKDKAAVVHARLKKIGKDNPNTIQEVRGRGLIIGVEFFETENAQKVARECFKEGLVIETCGAKDHILKLLPPLIIDKSDLEEGLDILENVISKLDEL